MDIKLKARLSAYSRFPHSAADKQCPNETVTKEDIDSLFGNSSSIQPDTKVTPTIYCGSETVSAADIDSLFKK